MNNNKALFSDAEFVYYNNALIKGWHRCSDIKEYTATLDTYNNEFDSDMLTWVAEPIPKQIMIEFAGLAKAFPKTEVMAVLFYSIREKKWIYHIPEQQSTGASITYNAEYYTPPAGYSFLGTIHTHPEMGAFWSGTDKNDQCGKDGLHVVLGLKDGNITSYKCSLFLNKQMYDSMDKVELPDKDDVLPEPSEEIKARIKPPVKIQIPVYVSSMQKKPVSFHSDSYSSRFKNSSQRLSWYNDSESDWDCRYDTRWDEDYFMSDSIYGEIEHEMDEMAYEVLRYFTREEALKICANIAESLGDQDISDFIESHIFSDYLTEEELSDSDESLNHPDIPDTIEEPKHKEPNLV